MRDLINIVEEKLLDVRTPSVKELAKKHGVSLARVNKELQRGIKIEKEHTTDEDVAREIALDHLGEKIDYYELLAKVEGDENVNESVELPAQFSKLIKDGTIEVWRAISAGSGFLVDLVPGCGLGKCWSYEENGAIPYDGSKGIIYRLHASLPSNSVDWDKTISLTGSGECEIRAKSGYPLVLLGVDRISISGDIIQSDLVPNLTGAKMTTGPWV